MAKADDVIKKQSQSWGYQATPNRSSHRYLHLLKERDVSTELITPAHKSQRSTCSSRERFREAITKCQQALYGSDRAERLT